MESSKIIVNFCGILSKEYRKGIESLKWFTYQKQLSTKHTEQKF